ncbi:hypothetical protein EDM56_11335 [Brevibacillus fluminis]|uniref:Uncharacterized protein n=1 Tax=Brevibacillus fluminis TaxID=511487 RepID=A0A3M8DNT7_9BACL|nr:hypothetical protein EDM56_11335 [Brevibacillus fluminis]
MPIFRHVLPSSIFSVLTMRWLWTFVFARNTRMEGEIDGMGEKKVAITAQAFRPEQNPLACQTSSFI